MQAQLISSIRDAWAAAKGCLQLRLNDQGKPELSLMQCHSGIGQTLLLINFSFVLKSWSLSIQKSYLQQLLRPSQMPRAIIWTLPWWQFAFLSAWHCHWWLEHWQCTGQNVLLGSHSAPVWVNRSGEQGRQIWFGSPNTEKIEQKL